MMEPQLRFTRWDKRHPIGSILRAAMHSSIIPIPCADESGASILAALLDGHPRNPSLRQALELFTSHCRLSP